MRSRGVPAVSRTCEGPLDFFEGRHAARENDRLAVAADLAQVRQIRDLARGNLESLRTELGQKLDAFRVEAAGEKLDSAHLAVGYERLMHVARELQPAQHRVLGFVGRPTIASGTPLSRRGRGEAIRLEGLELDQVRARLGGRIDQSASQSQVAVMVDAGLGDDQCTHVVPLERGHLSAVRTIGENPLPHADQAPRADVDQLSHASNCCR